MTELIDLVGKHILTGVDEFTRPMKIGGWSDSFEDCQCINFVLDGLTYTAIEDPEDGYRSSLREIIVSNDQVTNNFQPIEVVASYRDKNGYSGDCDILDIVDAKNGKRVLEIGTDDTNDYYPEFVANWTPENLSINEGKDESH